MQLIRFPIDFDKRHGVADTVSEIENELKTFKDHKRTLKIEFLENQSRINNIRFENIPEDDHETWSSTEMKVRHVLEENWP